MFALFAVLESKGKLRGKAKAQRKKEEKEKKSTVKIQGDELKDNLADNDDSSSTTTETSNPDVETNIKEVRWSHITCSLCHYCTLHTSLLPEMETRTQDAKTCINLMCWRREHKRGDLTWSTKNIKKKTKLCAVCIDAQITKMCTMSHNLKHSIVKRRCETIPVTASKNK